MRITTTYTTGANGAGKVVAKGGGKQFTRAYEPGESVSANHGSAAGILARRLLPMVTWQKAADTAKVDRPESGRMVFTFTTE